MIRPRLIVPLLLLGLVWLACNDLPEGEEGTTEYAPLVFKNVQWNTIPSDFLISTAQYYDRRYVRTACTSRVFYFRKADSSIQSILVSDSLIYEDIALSPDGKQLAFCSFFMEHGQPTEMRQIYVINLETGEGTHMPGEFMTNYQDLAWSPAGPLAYTSQDWVSRDSLKTIWIDGTACSPLVDPTTSLFWSAEGRFLYFEGQFGNALQVIDATDRSVSTLLSTSSPIIPRGFVPLLGGIPTQRGIYVNMISVEGPHSFFLSYDGTSLETTKLYITTDAFVFPSDRRIVVSRLGSNWLLVSNTETEDQRNLFWMDGAEIVGACAVY